MCRCESGQRKGRMQYFSNLDHVLIRPTKTLTYTTWQCKQTHALAHAHAPHMRIEKAWARARVAWAAQRVPSHEQTHAQEQTHAHTHTQTQVFPPKSVEVQVDSLLNVAPVPFAFLQRRRYNFGGLFRNGRDCGRGRVGGARCVWGGGTCRERGVAIDKVHSTR